MLFCSYKSAIIGFSGKEAPMSTSIPETTLEKFTTFGDLLRFLRRRAGITQLELSIAVGYSDAQISRLEQNLRPPDIPTIEARFVYALGLEDEPKAVARLLDLAANVRREDAPGLGLCPYKGLNCFEEADADLFVGREELSAKLVERILSLTSNSAPNEIRFLAVVGASGSGKSSLVQAGIIPALRWNKKSIDWQIYIFTPTAHPLESLATSLTRESSSVTATVSLIDDLARDQRSLQIFGKRKLGAKDGSHLLLVVDQFEELFALCRSEEERAAFISNLLTAASETDGPMIVLIALRADFYAHCANYIQLREALAKNQEYIGAMSEEELRRAIEEPARRGRWEFEPGLVDLLIHDIGREPGALPLLSHALLETWQRRRGRVMTLSGYTSSGGVRGAIAETAEAVFADRFTHDQQDVARRIFLRLTELGDETGTGDTRRRASFNELILKPEETNTTHTLLKVLADARLIVTSEDTVEVAHEALIREWPRLRSWLEDNREGLRLHRQLTEAAQEWDALNRDPDLLYRGARLTQAQEWGKTHQDEMNLLEREFLDASTAGSQREAAEREVQRQRELEAAQKLAQSENQRAEQQTSFARQMSKRAKYLTGAFIIALLMAFTALYFGSRARETAITAQNERRLATARELAAAALNNLNVDPERSLLLALQSVATTREADGTVLPESVEALHNSIVSSPVRMTLRGHETKVYSAAFSPNGKQLATIGDDGTTIIWNATNGEELLRLPGTTKPSDVYTDQRIAYSPNGKLLATCDSNQLKVYDPAAGELTMALSGHEADVISVAFSRDGKYLATGSADTTVRLWDVNTGGLIHVLKGHSAEVGGLAFSPDGTLLLTSSEDGMLIIWDVETGELLRDLPDFTVYKVDFSPDGTRVAAATFSGLQVWTYTPDSAELITFEGSQAILTIPDGSSGIFSPDGKQLAALSFGVAGGNAIKVQDAVTSEELLTLIGHTDWIAGLAFSPDGKRLASTSLDGTVRIWSLSPGEETVAVSGPGASYGTRVVYSPNGQEFATNGGDGTATIWNAKTGEPRLILTGHDIEVMNIAFSPDGTRFATGSLDGTTIIWDAASGKKLLTLSGHEDAVRDITFSPDGSLIATGGFDLTARVWDGMTGKELLKITSHEGIVPGVAFSPDGTRLATASTDGTSKIWDVKTGELLFTLAGHTSGVVDIGYSPDGKKIATASNDATAKIWDAATGKELLTLTGHSAEVRPVAFSPDGKFLATGSGDNTAKIWDVETGQELLTLPGSQGGVYGVAFSPSDGGSHLLVASNDGVVRVFLLQIDELLALAQSRVTRSFTTAECKKYLHVEQCPTEP
jgi:WD40 repeat protein/transcriptional regulator with XRE-family HTH domain